MATHVIRPYTTAGGVIKIRSFKPSGKYYDSFVLTISTVQPDKDYWFHVIDSVKEYKQTHPQSEMSWVVTDQSNRTDSYPVLLQGEV